MIRHLCSWKPCCNPAHLRLGTHAENQQDRLEVERSGVTPPIQVVRPQPPPAGGWQMVEEDQNRLERYARESEFWREVTRGGPRECWPWKGATRHTFGYGQMAFDGGRAVPAHRISWAIAHGLSLAEITRTTHIRHVCPGGANNLCVNPDHLAEGTAADNRADTVRDGRVPAGEDHHAVRVTDAQVKNARERYFADSSLTATDIAHEYRVAIQTVCSWLTGKGRKGAGGPTGPVRFIPPPH